MNIDIIIRQLQVIQSESDTLLEHVCKSDHYGDATIENLQTQDEQIKAGINELKRISTTPKQKKNDVTQSEKEDDPKSDRAKSEASVEETDHPESWTKDYNPVMNGLRHLFKLRFMMLDDARTLHIAQFSYTQRKLLLQLKQILP